jgi:hypothetical protein
VISITVSSSEILDIKNNLIPFPIVENMTNLIVCFFPPEDAQMNLWILQYGNIVLLTNGFLDVVKVKAS